MKENPYVEILQWAYDKRDEGFTEPTLLNKFNLDKTFYERIFKSGANEDEALIKYYYDKGGERYYGLTAKGLSAAIDYLGLEEARKTGRRAERIALWAISISIGVGAIDIFVNIGSMILSANKD